MIDDTACIALSVVVQRGIGDMAALRRQLGGSAWSTMARFYAEPARRALEDGSMERVISECGGRLDGLGAGLAVLAMRPGGVRVCELVFCAWHYPGGTECRLRYSCPRCAPGDFQDINAGLDRRPVFSIEGTL